MRRLVLVFYLTMAPFVTLMFLSQIGIMFAGVVGDYAGAAIAVVLYVVFMVLWKTRMLVWLDEK